MSDVFISHNSKDKENVYTNGVWDENDNLVSGNLMEYDEYRKPVTD